MKDEIQRTQTTKDKIESNIRASQDRINLMLEKQKTADHVEYKMLLDKITQEREFIERCKAEVGKLDSKLNTESITKVSEQPTEKHTYLNTGINEQEVIRQHYDRIVMLQREINLKERVVTEYQATGNKELKKEYIQAFNALPYLKKELADLERMDKDLIILNAKKKKAAYLNAKDRYKSKSVIERLKLKMRGRSLATWDKVKNDDSITTSKLDVMYQQTEGKRL